MASVLITGGNRGIGLELVRCFLRQGWEVHACCRQPGAARELQALAAQPALTLHQLEVLSDESIARLRRELDGVALDLLINNAGSAGNRDRSAFGDMDYDDWMRLFRVNTFGPMKVLEALVDNLAAGEQKHAVAISSGLASIPTQNGYMLPYASSKTALNSVMKSLSAVLKERGIRVNMLSPGWVRTDMGGMEAPLSAVQSAGMLYENIMALGKEDTGLFIGLEGNIIPW